MDAAPLTNEMSGENCMLHYRLPGITFDGSWGVVAASDQGSLQSYGHFARHRSFTQ